MYGRQTFFIHPIGTHNKVYIIILLKSVGRYVIEMQLYKYI